MQGVHGRRRAGQGDAFWQFRPYLPGDDAARVDWRQSAQVRPPLPARDASGNPRRPSRCGATPARAWTGPAGAARPTKGARAELLLLALASLLLRGGERVRLLGGGRGPLPAGARCPRWRDAARWPVGPPADETLPRHARAVLFGDFLAPLPDLRAALSPLAAAGRAAPPSSRSGPRRGNPALQRPRPLRADGRHRPRPRAAGGGHPRASTPSAWPPTGRASRRSPVAAASGSCSHRTDHPPGPRCWRCGRPWRPRACEEGRLGPRWAAHFRRALAAAGAGRVAGPVVAAARHAAHAAAAVLPARPASCANLPAAEETPSRTPWWLLLLRLVGGGADRPRPGPPRLERRGRATPRTGRCWSCSTTAGPPPPTGRTAWPRPRGAGRRRPRRAARRRSSPPPPPRRGKPPAPPRWMPCRGGARPPRRAAAPALGARPRRGRWPR